MNFEKNLPWWRADRPWGFRFSWIDAVIIVLGVLIAIISLGYSKHMSICVVFVVGHFFLFCNVFRLGGERSLIWIGLLFINFFVWIELELFFSWQKVILTQVLVTSILIANCVFSKNYHGYMCEKINSQNFQQAALTEGAFVRKILLAVGIPKKIIETLTGRKLSDFDVH